MTTLFVVLIVVFAIGAAIGAFALLAPKKRAAPVAAAAVAPVSPVATVEAEPSEEPDWTHEALAEFRRLPEDGRCDAVFAMSALEDERSRRLLIFALDDSSEAVALAAAHALVRTGRIADVEQYATQHAGDRASALLRTLALLS
jgi:hypothetical protein